MSTKIEIDMDKILQKLFIYEDNNDMNINRIHNLIVNPQILRVLIYQLSQMSSEIKISSMGKVAEIYKKNSLNLCIMFKRDREIMEFNHSIFDEIVSFALGIKIDIEHNQQIFQTFQPLISGYPIGCRNVKNIVSKLAKNFNNQNFNVQKLQLSILILKQIFMTQMISLSQPKCFFYMYGPNSGIKLINQNIKWSLHKGFYFYIYFCLESLKHQGMSLIHINVNGDTFQLSINQQCCLTVKVFSVKKVQQFKKKLKQKKWYFLKMAYCLRNGIIRNTFQLALHIQGEPFELRELPIPSPTIKDNIDELVVGHEFYGKINYIAISRCELRDCPKTGISNWQQIETLFEKNKQVLKQMFLFYSPIVTSVVNQQQILHELINKNNAEMLDNTGIYWNPFDQVDINYYGGLYTLIPLFYILRFYKYEEYTNALTDMLELLTTTFQYKFKNVQNQAINCQFFGILAEFINQVDYRYITPDTIQKISTFKDYISSSVLKKQYLQDCLFKIRVGRIKNIPVIQKLHHLIASFYYGEFNWSLEVASMYQIIWYAIDNFQPQKKQDCCILHCWEQNYQGLSYNHIQEIQQHYKLKCTNIKQLLKFIIKELCSKRKYQLLIPKKIQVEDISFDYVKKNDKFSIFEFLKFEGYSICLKKMLLECIQVGVTQDPQTLIKQTQLLECMYNLLQISQIRDQFTPVINVLNQCSKNYKITNDQKNLQIIKQIGKQLNRLEMKKYAEIKYRSKSQGVAFRQSFSFRKMSQEIQDNMSNDQNIKQKGIKDKILQLKKDKKLKISNDKQLYQLLISICCTRQPQSYDLILIHDDCTKIINPYFKICCLKYRVKLIQIIRTTVLVRSKLQNLPPNMDKLYKFDYIYRFVLSQFILRELQPKNPQYQPSQQTNYIIKNFFYIVDHMVITMKNNWESLYRFILRMVGILTQARKQIHKKTQRTIQQIKMACKVCVRKFILRVIKHTQKSIQNMGNLAFLIYLTIFNNQQQVQHQLHIFQYFQSLQKHFLIGPIIIKNHQEHELIQKNIFIDQKIILAYLQAFKMQQVFNMKEVQPTKQRKYMQNIIKAYLQLQQTNQLQDYLYKLQKVFLSKSMFKQFNHEDNQGIRNMISNYFIGNGDNKIKDTIAPQQLYVCQIIGLLLCLLIEQSLNTHRQQIFKQSLEQSILFIKSFSLACSRDCLKKKDHDKRNDKITNKTVYHLLHFLYEMMEQTKNNTQKYLIQVTIYQIVNFITLLISILSQKIGNPQKFNDMMILSSIMPQVQQYNFFLFNLFKDVLNLSEIRTFATFSMQKGCQVLKHNNIKQYFNISPKVFLQIHIKQVVEIHKLNLEKIQKQLQQKFQQKSQQQTQNTNTSNLDTNINNNNNQFQQYCLNHTRKLDIQYRHMMKNWRKIWKRLRLFHYYWSISMDQKQQIKWKYQKFKQLPYKHKFGKYTDLDGLRPMLQVQPNQPWHVKKAQLQQQVQYRSKNFMLHLYKYATQGKQKKQSLITRLLKTSSISNQFIVLWIKHNSKRKGKITITSEKLIFQYESTFQKDSHVDFNAFTLAQHRPMQKVWSLATITNILKRRYLMRKQCLLIQFEDSSSVIFDFINDDTDDFFSRIQQVQAQKSDKYNFMKANKIIFYTKKFKKNGNYQAEIQQSMEQWSEGKITNLHYLMILNKYSGRNYLDPVSYPVMPWIISNYQTQQFQYRDLSKTLGAFGSQTRKQWYQNKANTIDPFNNDVPAFQYGTHYSSPGVVFNFFIRISPYTEAARNLQGRKFDISDRLFSSIRVCWHSVINQVSDVRELNPEFFYLPQFLINIENYDFGITQQQERIDNVILPIWAADAYQFIYNHRNALQSDEVSMSIQNWIDLIFGYKQKGKIAKDNLNLFYYLTYQDSIDIKKINDPITRKGIEAQIIHFGQTPSQLFNKSHPIKKFVKPIKHYSQAQKIKFLGLIQSQFPIMILGQIDHNLMIFNDSNLLTVSLIPSFQIKSIVSLLRSTSKQKLYYLQDMSIQNRIILFGNKKYIAISSYVNGDLIIYNINGKKIHEKKGAIKSIIYVNKKQNLLLCGCKNGLLQVYQIVYSQKQTVNLIKIVSQYYMFPIQHISQGGGFFCISFGHFVVINKITRGLHYIYDKIKMQGTKMIRAFQPKQKVQGAYICTNPLYCVVFYNSLQVYIYSINGQFLKLRQVENVVNPILMVDYMLRENVLVLDKNGILVFKVPQLQKIWSIPVPDKKYIDMKIVNDNLYLITNNGEVLFVFNQKQVIFY